MPFSAPELDLDVQAKSVRVTDETISVDLEDGRSIAVPTAWYPRLKHATAAERDAYEIGPYGVEWPGVEADFSVRGLRLGHKSGESRESFKFWLDARKKGRKTSFQDFMKQHRARKVQKRKRR